jgi:alkylation response protein AidB-like acyl-CoA dehydrogenase
MDLEYTEDQLALRDAARSVLASACPPSVVRGVHEGTGDGAELWRTLGELDWPGLGIDAAHGGVGLGMVEVGIVVEELGRVAAPTPYLATATQLVPLLAEAGATARLPELAAGSVTGTLALAERGSWSPHPVSTTARPGPGGWVLDGVKSHVLDGATADELAVVAVADAGLGVFLVPGAAVAAHPIGVLDPTMPLATVVLDGVAVGPERVVVEPGDPTVDEVLERARLVATAALAVSTVATCRAIFESTLQYAKDRHQFGRPIGSFQAVKHRLADCYLAVERAAALATVATVAIAEDDRRRPLAISMAKAAAGDCQRLLARDGLQLHGGIGFTWEHDLHLLLKRAVTGELLFGTSAWHRARVGALLGLEATA